MITVKARGGWNGVVWDKENNKPLARFKDDAFLTQDAKAAEKLKKMGYSVVKPKEDKPNAGTTQNTPPNNG